MIEIECFDPYGNRIEHYTQWDIDQEITMVLNGCDTRHLEVPPEVHFANGKSTEAIVATSKVIGDNSIVADIPNDILTQEYPILIYVYAIDKNDMLSKKTIASTQIQMVKRARPDDYNG